MQRLMSSIHQAGGTILANFKGTFNSSAAKVSRQYAIMLGKPISNIQSIYCNSGTSVQYNLAHI